jgi:hypothetical protein
MQIQTITPTRTRQPLTSVIIMQRLEGITLLGAALTVYHTQGFGWLLFALLLLAPDLAALGYLVSSRAGNLGYNLAHTLAFPLALAVLAGLMGYTLGLQIALIWLAHIGMDRAVGYGFKEGDMPRPADRASR